jgi:hypothetical protein
LLNGGTGYNIGDTLTVYGTVIGGATPANDLVITVVTVSDIGAILTYSYTGSGDGTEVNFSLTPYLYTATNLDSFIVTVNSQVQRPHIDYEFNNDSTDATQDLTFINVPPVGAVISVRASQYWQYVSTLNIPSLTPDAKFGISITTTSDGRQVLIGAEQANVGVVSRAGAVYAFDRSSVKYVINNTAQLTYAIPGVFLDPVAVILNKQYLLLLHH